MEKETEGETITPASREVGDADLGRDINVKILLKMGNHFDIKSKQTRSRGLRGRASDVEC